MLFRRNHIAALLGLTVCLAALLPQSAHSDDAPTTPCRDYTGTFTSEYKIGSERNIGEVAALIPVACDTDDLLYSDIRLKGDSEDGREINVALGLRRLKDRGVAGGYVYLDRKKSGATDKYFTQTTIGAEYLANDWEARANAYVPLSDEKIGTGNPGAVVGVPFLNGSGIFVNVAGATSLREIPMGGGDVELGYKIPHAKLWLHGAGFAFDGAGADALYGGRARARYDLTNHLAVTAEAQHDNIRDNQGWLGMRVTVPFGTQHASYQGTLRARMTDSPVRDVDIVTSAVEQDIPGVAQRAVRSAASGQAQRVFHVDNSLGAAGDGTLATPFNTLAAAQSAANRAGDVVYVHSGTGTSVNLDTGFNISYAGQSLLGEGSAFTYDGTRFRSPTGEDFTGTVLRAAGVAPVISNTLDRAVTVTADNAWLSGFTVDSAAGEGIRLSNADSARLDNLTISNNAGQGIRAQYTDGRSYSGVSMDNLAITGNASAGIAIDITASTLASMALDNVTLNTNTGRGLDAVLLNGGVLDDLTITNSNADSNDGGIYLTAFDADSRFETVSITDTSASNNINGGSGIEFSLQSDGAAGDITLGNLDVNTNAGSGVNFALSQATVDTIDLINLIADDNGSRGVLLSATNNAAVDEFTLDGLHAFGNIGNGLAMNITTGAVVTTADLSNSDTQNNGNRGLYLNINNGGTLTTATLDQITSSNNTGGSGLGIDIVASGASSSIGSVALTNTTTDGNAEQGIRFNAASLGQIGSITATTITADSNGNAGLLVNAATGGTITSASLDDITSTNNTGASGSGIAFSADNVSGAQAANIGTVTATNLTTSGNALYGIYASATNGAGLDTLGIDGAVVDTNASNGIYLLSQTGGTLGNMTIENATVTNSAGRGIYALANSSAITSLTLDTVTVSGSTGGNGHGIQIASTTGGAADITATLTNVTTDTNALHGIYLQTTGAANLSVAVADSTSNDNTGNGIFVDHDSTGSFTADLGGGTLGSLGNNRFFDNVDTEIRVDLDGAELKAENNWWGDVLGLQPAETTLDAGSTIDADPFLAADPGP